MSIQKRWFLCAAVLFAGLSPALALVGFAPVLTNAVRSVDQFEFTLKGETNVSYIIEFSPDLRAWTAAITNSDPEATRTVIVPAASARALWRVRPVPSPLFEYAIVAQGSILFGGSGRIDSFDSADPLQSGPGGSYDASLASDHAVVATTSRAAGALSVGNMSIYGSVGTGPGGTVTVNPNGNVGSKAYNDNPGFNGTIQPGHFDGDFRVVLPRPTLPRDFVAATLLAAGTYPIGGTNYKYAILADGDYRATSISLGNGEKMLINARARLYVIANTAVSGVSSYILLGPDASIEWYAGGQVTLSGGGCINASQLATHFSVVGLSTNAISYSSSSRLVGTIYAPTGAVALTGTSDAVGAVVCNSFTLSGTMGIHFDENLTRVGPWR